MSLLLLLWLSAVVPNGILVKGAMPSASDATTPVPENGRIGAGRYRNAYFQLSYPIPSGWTEQPEGPPPSDLGGYVLTQFAAMDGERVRAHVLVTAHDLFFIPFEVANARGFAARARATVPANYEIEQGAEEVTIAGRTFYRLAYKAPRSGLRWRSFTTEERCHALTFTFTGTEAAALDDAERALAGLTLGGGKPPACVSDYARENVVAQVPPSFAQRHNTIPVRVIIDAKGKVKHAHLLSAFPEQSHAILAALREWRFKPYVVKGRAVEVETGLVFGFPRPTSSNPASS